MIQGMIKEGKIVPSEVTVKLLEKAMNESSTDKFLIDGFPRNEENRAAFETVVSCLVSSRLPPKKIVKDNDGEGNRGVGDNGCHALTPAFIGCMHLLCLISSYSFYGVTWRWHLKVLS